MNCPSCSYTFDATNQHSTCPECGAKVGTQSERDEAAELERFMQWFTDWDDGTIEARELTSRDCDYYDGHQLTDEQIAKLRKRKQPPLVFNRIGKKIDYLRGAEIRNRTSPKALPRTPTPVQDSDAAAITDAIRYVCDTERVDRIFSRDYKGFLTAGICGHVTEKEIVGEGDKQDICIRVKAFNWDRLWWDLTSRTLDFSEDCLYKGTAEWMDHADAVRCYKKRKDAVANIEQVLEGAKAVKSRAAAGSETYADVPRWYDPKRKRVQVLVVFYKEDGKWMTAHFVNGGFLVKPRPTGYVDEQGVDYCPLVMASAFCDEEGNRYGLVRRMISAQDEINNRRSRLVHRSNTRQTWIERGAVADADMPEWKKQIQMPDGVPVFAPGALSNQKARIERDEMANQTDMALLAEAKEQIESLGPNTPTAADAATSGRDRQLQQQLGSLEIEPMNDVFREMKRLTYRHIYLCVRSSWTYQKWMRVADDTAESGYRFVGLNRSTTKGQRIDEMMQEGVPVPQALAAVGFPPEAVQALVQQSQGSIDVLRALPDMDEPHMANDVSKLDVDIVIDEAPDTSAVQHEVMQDLRELGQSAMSAGQPFPIDLYVENSDLRPQVKAKWLERLRPKNPDPHAQQMQAMMQQMQQTMLQLEAQLKQADVQKTQAEANLANARAADLGRPDAPEAPQMPSPVEHARAQREQIGTQLDIARAHSHMQRDAAQTQKLHVDAMATAQRMMEPKPTPQSK